MTGRSALVSYDPAIGVYDIGEIWTLWRRGLPLRCRLTTHPHGWELRVHDGTEFARSHVCKTQTEVFDTADAWKAEAIGKGWRPLE